MLRVVLLAVAPFAANAATTVPSRRDAGAAVPGRLQGIGLLTDPTKSPETKMSETLKNDSASTNGTAASPTSAAPRPERMARVVEGEAHPWQRRVLPDFMPGWLHTVARWVLRVSGWFGIGPHVWAAGGRFALFLCTVASAMTLFFGLPAFHPSFESKWTLPWSSATEDDDGSGDGSVVRRLAFAASLKNAGLPRAMMERFMTTSELTHVRELGLVDRKDVTSLVVHLGVKSLIRANRISTAIVSDAPNWHDAATHFDHCGVIDTLEHALAAALLPTAMHSAFADAAMLKHWATEMIAAKEADVIGLVKSAGVAHILKQTAIARALKHAAVVANDERTPAPVDHAHALDLKSPAFATKRKRGTRHTVLKQRRSVFQVAPSDAHDTTAL